MTSRNNIKIFAGAIVCEEAKLRGDITIGANTIVHPCAIINAEAGPIIIGENCLIEEQAKIIHRASFAKADPDSIPVMTIGCHNVFEVDCTVEAAQIGDNNVFESKSFVGNKVFIPNGCIVGAGCKMLEGKTLINNTIVHGAKCQIREGFSQPAPQIAQMETLAKILPNYHHYRKSNKK